jgi:16S rRNA (cytosine967-C5)-methyltransferase
MKAFHQLSTFQKIISEFKNDEPLSRFLGLHYRQNKQMGSRDRRLASRLVYNYFRLGNAFSDIDLVERLAVAEFLCNDISNSFLEYYQPEWNNQVELSLAEKLALVKEKYAQFDLKDVFPFHEHFSEGIDQEAYLLSFFTQPDLFIRVKATEEQKIKKLLASADIKFEAKGNQTIALSNGTTLEQIIADSGSYEIQDWSSQKVGQFFEPKKWEKWWDCCAASGGKTLLLHALQPDLKLLVTDNRESILENLQQRFALAGIRSYQKKVFDLTLNQDLFLHDYEFDGIIFDAPCSGSGTWGRTPEMIAQFATHKIKFYTELQKKIANNVVKYLKPEKPLIYITCSVFKEENEDQVKWLCDTFNLEIEKQELIKGYEFKADTMFVARLIKGVG